MAKYKVGDLVRVTIFDKKICKVLEVKGNEYRISDSIWVLDVHLLPYIDEVELDRLARQKTGCLNPEDVDDPNYTGYHCFVLGYRMAKEEMA